MMGQSVPSPLGHALGGVAVAWAGDGDPSTGPQPRASTALTLACAALAVSPDLDLLFRGFHRTAMHSVTAALLVTIIAAGVTGWVNGRIDRRAALLCGLAYASHLLLDWLGADPTPPHGLQLLWPFSHAWFIAPWTIFPGTERRTILSAAAMLTNLKAAAVELALLGPLVTWLGARRTRTTRRAAASRASRPEPRAPEAETPQA